MRAPAPKTSKRTANHAKRDSAKRGEARPGTWQARKSKIFQDVILKAASECMAEEGYNAFSFDTVARRAGLSVGGMQYHFKSKTNLIKLMCRYVFDQHLTYSRTVARNQAEPITLALHARRVETEWNYLQLPFYVVFVELAVAGRSDPKLGKLVRQEYARYKRLAWQQYIDAMPEWCADMDSFSLAGELGFTVLEGMRLRQLFGQSDEEMDRRIREYLTLIVATIFEKGASAPVAPPPKRRGVKS